MAIRMTRRHIIGALVLATLVAGLAGTVALRASKQAAARDQAQAAAPVALQFVPADLAYVENTSLARWLPVSGAGEWRSARRTV